MNTSPSARSRRLVAIMATSDLYRSYSAAFERMTSLRLELQPVNDNESLEKVQTTTADNGVVQSRVPVKLGKSLISALAIGGVRLVDKPKRASNADVPPTMERDRYEAALALLRSFAFQLGESTHRLLFASGTRDPEPVRQAKAYIMEHLTEPMTLGTVASQVNVSPFHFCKVFKRATTMTFTDFVNHARVEKARRLLLRPDVRITEVAYDVGFQSLTHFNRSFRRIVCESPTEYRARMKQTEPTVMAA